MRQLIAVLVFCIGCMGQSLPDAPQPQPGYLPYCQVYPSSSVCPHKDGFFSFRTWQEPMLKPNKKSWVLFAAANAAPWIALATSNHQKEAWHSEAPALAGINALDFLAFKTMSPSFSVGGGIYSFIHYLRAR